MFNWNFLLFFTIYCFFMIWSTFCKTSCKVLILFFSKTISSLQLLIKNFESALIHSKFLMPTSLVYFIFYYYFFSDFYRSELDKSILSIEFVLIDLILFIEFITKEFSTRLEFIFLRTLKKFKTNLRN